MSTPSQFEPRTANNEIRPVELAFWYLLGVSIAAVLFWFFIGFDVNLRIRGDAYSYLQLAAQSDGILGVLDASKQGSTGLPMILKLLQLTIAPLLPTDAAPWYEYAPYFFFVFHVSTMAILYHSLSRLLTERYGLPPPHPLWLFLLLIHPGLIANTSLLLSDIWSNDLMLLGIALIASMGRHGTGGNLALGGIAGLSWSWAVLSRPSFGAGALAGIAGLVILAFLERKRMDDTGLLSPTRMYGLIGTFALITVLAGLPCSLHYRTFCIVNPTLSEDAVSFSLVKGLSNVRLYWSSFSPSPDGMEVVNDPWLEQNLRGACDLPEDSPTGTDAIRCLVSHPGAWPAFFAKKVMALVDQQHFQSYTTHATSAHARRAFRPFSALTWAGLCLWAGWVLLNLPRYPLLAILSIFPWMVLATHSLMHVEFRYSLGIIPGAYLALGVLHTRLKSSPNTTAVLRLAAGLALASLIAWFYWQVGAWDRLDEVQGITDVGYDRNIRH